jgi:hypothetical protein
MDRYYRQIAAFYKFCEHINKLRSQIVNVPNFQAQILQGSSRPGSLKGSTELFSHRSQFFYNWASLIYSTYTFNYLITLRAVSDRHFKTPPLS